jgi:outer membrane protein OmpA-like peptidoglycan-associated protein
MAGRRSPVYGRLASDLGRYSVSPIAQAFGLLALLVLAATSSAQTSAPRASTLSFFAGASLAQNYSTASIPAYDGSTACGIFTSGVATRPGFNAGALLSPVSFPFGLRVSASYDDLSSSFVTPADANGSAPLAFRLSDHTYIPIARERSFDASLSMLALHALAAFDLFSGLGMNAGVYAGLVTRHTYAEGERIVQPSDAVYDENRLSHRSIGAGDLATHSLQAGLEAALHYDFHFQRDLWLEPRLEYRFPFTSLSDRSTSAWRISPAAAGLAIVYRVPARDEQPVFTVATWDSLIRSTPPAQPPAKPLPVLAASIAVLDTAGAPILDPKLEIERTHVVEVFPMLHYVFFEDGSSEIPPRYDIAGEFTGESELAGLDALDIHHHILDVIGKRLSEKPTATITITGTRSEHAAGDARATMLAQERAKNVARYLEDRWKIPASRVRVVARSLPEAASDDRTPSGQAENRRVELTSNDPSITRPVTVERIERTATPPSFNFEPRILASAGVRSATITVRQGRRVLMTANAITGAVQDEYVWSLDDRSMPDTRDSLVFELQVQDSTGQTAVATGSIHLATSERDRYVHRSDTALSKDVHRYSLILFDYSSSQLDKRKADALMTEMARTVLDSSQIRLTGHTDQTGDDEFNEELARQRVERAAQILAKRLAEFGQAAHPIAIESRGSRDHLFDNSLPEGRLLSRTVRAFIEHDLP